ncbi:UDP-glucose 4-epimerase GalE [Paenibacillus nasutitermitis]|uniref:UDP-glucose 4-epimerase n=1 Tax=Paenibacillus nasutitermitis TaxID=1652958 RepID=A0A916Z2P9_9BACL|nr:UDP-glucose 4-epimerase GalE [Paenibacillus nasutitermitis]GGD73245.1 UDP-glucose 4-epimerase [Paenibacillus nasutitermitis]
MAILVTGGAGYIGSHTCVELLEAGYEIVVVDNYTNSSPEALNRVMEITGRTFPVYELDLRDRGALAEVFEAHSIDAVIHFAGLKAVGESVRSPLWYYEMNMNSTLVLCEVMGIYGVRRLVFSSSATVYGASGDMPLAEDSPVEAASPYGRTKQMIEQILQDLAVSDMRWSICILRYFNPVGAHKSGRIGENPAGIPNNLMPYLSQVAAGRLEQLSVYGSDYPTPDGTGIRDYIHVVDLALGHIRALGQIMDCAGLDIYNLGTGRGASVLEMIASFEQATGAKVPYRFAARRPGDIAVSCADVRKARYGLGWTASRGLSEMCEDTWRWQANNPDGYVSHEYRFMTDLLKK